MGRTKSNLKQIEGEDNIWYIPTVDIGKEKFPEPFDIELHVYDDFLRFVMQGKVNERELIDYDVELDEEVYKWEMSYKDFEYDLYRDSLAGVLINMFEEERVFQLIIKEKDGENIPITFKLRRDAKKIRDIINQWKAAA